MRPKWKMLLGRLRTSTFGSVYLSIYCLVKSRFSPLGLYTPGSQSGVQKSITHQGPCVLLDLRVPAD